MLSRYWPGVLLALVIGGAEAKEIHCRSTLKFGNEGSLQMSVSMQIREARLNSIELSHLTLVNSTKTGYQCDAHFDIADPSNAWRFSDEKTEIILAGESPEESSRLVVSGRSHGYLIDTMALSTAECGVRAQWPLRVFVPAKGGRCRTSYE